MLVLAHYTTWSFVDINRHRGRLHWYHVRRASCIRRDHPAMGDSDFLDCCGRGRGDLGNPVCGFIMTRF